MWSRDLLLHWGPQIPYLYLHLYLSIYIKIKLYLKKNVILFTRASWPTKNIHIYIEWKQLYRWTMYRCLPTTFITNHWWYKKWINRNVAATRIAVSEWVSPLPIATVKRTLSKISIYLPYIYLIFCYDVNVILYVSIYFINTQCIVIFI